MRVGQQGSWMEVEEGGLHKEFLCLIILIVFNIITSYIIRG